MVFLLQTCAHRWVNMASKNNWYMNGLCYLIPQDFNTNFITTLPILHDSSLQYIYTSPFWELHYGMGALGSSMQYTSQVVIIFVVCLFVCIRSVSRPYDRQFLCSLFKSGVRLMFCAIICFYLCYFDYISSVHSCLFNK